MTQLFTTILRPIARLAALLLLLLAAPVAWAQSITSFAPATGVAGTSFVVNGTGFSGVQAVKVAGVNASFTINSSTALTVVVPDEAHTGEVFLTYQSGSVFSSFPFKVLQPTDGPIVLDGYREARYGKALATQYAATQFGNATNGSQTTALGGSELDAAYTYVHGDSLYVFLAGNLESNGNVVDIFFDTQTGGQNKLTSTNPNVDGDGLNAMAGLTFDTKFSPDYYLSVRALQTGGVMQAYFAALGAGGAASSPASTGTGRVVTLTLPGSRSGILAIDQSNTGGVNGSSSTSGDKVVTGLEFVLPLAALGSPTGALTISAFVNNGTHTFLSNQVLDALGPGAANLGAPAGVNFSVMGGNQYFYVNIPKLPTITSFTPATAKPGASITINGTNLNTVYSIYFTTADGSTVAAAGSFSYSTDGTQLTGVIVPATAVTGVVRLYNTGGQVGAVFTVLGTTPGITSLAPTTGVAGTAVAITGANLTGATSVSFNGTAAISFNVDSDTQITAVVPVGAATGTVSVTTSKGTTASSTSFVVLQPSTRSVIVLDGYREKLYGSALATQAVATGFGNATNGDPANAVGGSELDAAYAYVSGDSLHVFLAGNLENNNNALNVFFDSQAGGQNVLTAVAGFSPYSAQVGLTFDAGFTADYALVLTTQANTVFGQFGNLATGAVGSLAAGSSRAVTVPAGAFGVRVNMDQSNTGGVSGAQAYGAAPAAVVTGTEFVLPLAALGSPTGSLKIAAYVNSNNQNFLSNQVLGSLPVGTNNLGDPSKVSFASLAGNQYFTVSVPATTRPSITSFTPASGAPGATVTITGTNLAGATSVTFGGVAGTGVVVNANGTSLTVTVPAGASTGPITVTTPGGATASSTVFTVTQAQAVITSIAPANGVAGTAVTITGTNFTDATAVSFNGTAAATYTVTSATTITAVVPVGATTGTVSVTTATNTANGSIGFRMLQPRTRAVIVQDGYRESLYGTALAVQQAATGFGNATNGDAMVALSGSELDAAYAYVSGDSLHVFLAGNLENNKNALNVFFDSKPGGQTKLTGLGNGSVYDNLAGLTFDAAFGADYVLSLSNGIGANNAQDIFAQFGDLNTNTVYGYGLGTSRSVTLPLGSYSGKLSTDQSNTGGVDGGSTYGAAPAAVVTGIEFVLPLAALGSPSGSLKIAALITNPDQNFLSNQVLGPLPAGTANLANPVSAVNFDNIAGNQYFTVALPASSSVPSIVSFTPVSGPVGTTVVITGTNLAGATSVTFNGTAAVGIVVGQNGTQLTVVVPSGATTGAIKVTTATGSATSSSVFTVVSGAPLASSFAPANGVAGTAVTITGQNLAGTSSVKFNGTTAATFTVNSATSVTAVVPVGATTGVITVGGPNGLATTATSFVVLQPTAGKIVLDGYRESRYGNPQALQTITTGFGNATNGSQTTALSGSELDAAYTYVHGDSLYVLMTGNVENGMNSLDVFFDTQAGGQNVLTNNNPDVDSNGLNAMAGLTFDPGFTADYYFTVHPQSTGGTVVGASFASLGTAGTGVANAATGAGRVVTLALPNGLAGTLALDNANTGGVSDALASTGLAAGTVQGIEFVLPLAALGSPTGSIKVAAFVVNSSHSYLSNQVLAPLPTGTTNLASPATANFGSYAGNQYFTVALPAPAAPVITSFSPVSGPVGTSVAITGTGFTGATAVTFNGTAATYTVNSATSLTVTVPAGATSGTIAVATPAGTATSATSFCVQYAATTSGGSRCGSGTVVLAASGAPAGGTYAYYAAATGGAALGTGASFTTPSLSATTRYYVGITTGSGNNACEGPRTAVTATINAVPTAIVSAGGPTTFCQGGSVVLTASGGSTYLWSTGATTASITVSAAGSYTATATNAAGCSATSNAVAVVVNPLPSINLAVGGPTTFCQGGSVVLTASGGSTYLWSTGATTASITVTTSGSYSVTGTSAAGCSSTPSAIGVVVNPTPDQPTVTASADGTTLTSSAASGNQWYLNGTAIAGATGPTYQPTTAGSYTVVTTSAAGCASPASAPQSVVLAAASPALAAQVRLFPNPTRGELTLVLPASAGLHVGQVRVLNTLGQVVQTRALAPNVTTVALDLTGLATGVYAVQVQLGSDTVTKRVVLE